MYRFFWFKMMMVMNVVPFVLTFQIPFSPELLDHQQFPLCCQCQHVYREPTSKTLCCRWFGEINVVTGQQHFTACTVARQDSQKCGIKGHYFIHYLSHQDDDDENKNK